MAASIPLVAAFVAAERRVAGTGGTPLIPGRVLRVPGVPVAIAALFTVMTIFSGFFFTLALHLQDGLGYTPLRAGLTFAPTAAAFALVSLNWRRLPAAVARRPDRRRVRHCSRWPWPAWPGCCTRAGPGEREST